MKQKNKNLSSGFTLIEVLIVIGILAILAGVVLIAINPGRQFSQARDTQRMSNVASILNAVGQNMVENKGIFSCNEEIPDVDNNGIPQKNIGSGSDQIDLYDCIVPTYLAEILIDPSDGILTDSENYDTGYRIGKTEEGRIVVDAPSAELDTIRVTR